MRRFTTVRLFVVVVFIYLFRMGFAEPSYAATALVGDGVITEEAFACLRSLAVFHHITAMLEVKPLRN